MEMLREYGIPVRGRRCVVLGRSNIVGKPMAMLLLQQDGTVTVCHSKTPGLAAITREADILVSAVGRVGLVTPGMVKEGAVVIDVAMNRNAEASCAATWTSTRWSPSWTPSPRCPAAWAP